ncbi:MAG: class I SAM-dependent methyltransferase [Bacteroidia bacterium]|nr:MAG: class I SAM-dependent methyltransferase [Bacteroidia bacterium]
MMDILRKVYYRLRPGQRRLARRLFYLPADVYERLSNKRPPLVPPRGRIFTGQGNFVAIGNNFLDLFIRHCSLKPHHHVLDIGCGIGRIARPLTTYLNESGRYEGFDIVKDGIDWCRKHYREFPHFQFTWMPLLNDLYNLESDRDAANLRFPYDDNSFDLVVLTSVFTHMQAGEVKNYLMEIGRIMKKDAHCFATFFLITETSEKYLEQSENPFFPFRYDNYFLHNKQVKNANIAYRHDFAIEMMESAGLIADQFYPGWWAGNPRDKCMDFQDVIIIKKRSE